MRQFIQVKNLSRVIVPIREYKMDRRNLFLLTAAATGSLLIPDKATSAASQLKYICYAPDDVVVEEIFVSSGMVNENDPLARLSSLQIARFGIRIKSLTELLSIYERPFKDGRLAQLLETLKTEASAATTELNAHKIVLKALEKRYEVGTATYEEIAQARADLDRAKAKKSAADIQLAQEPGRIKDNLDKLTLSKKHLEQEAELLKESERYLTIRAPKSGNFTIEVGVNGFVKKGDRIGVLVS